MLPLVFLFLLLISTLTAQDPPKGVFDNLLESSTSLVRHHRQVGEVKQRLYQESGDAWILRGFRNLAGCPRASRKFSVFRHDGENYAVVITSATENNTEIYHFTPEEGCRNLLVTLPTRSALDLQIVRTNQAIRLVVLEENPVNYPLKNPGLPVFKLAFEGKFQLGAAKRQVLPGYNSTCLTSWEHDGVPYIAICNNRTVDPSTGLMVYSKQSYVYRSSGGHFDRCDEIETHSAQQIRNFRIYNSHYLAIANHPRNKDDRHVPTEILRYHLPSKRYVHWQYLATKAAKDLCFFTLGSHPNELDHYLLVVNHHSFDAPNSFRQEIDSKIYKWVADRFEPFQSVNVPGAYSCVTHQAVGDGRFAIIFATSSGAITYQYDGWRFVPSIEYGQHSLSPGIRHLEPFTVNQDLYLAAANDDPEVSWSDNLFALSFERIHPNSTQSITASLRKNLATCQQIRSDLNEDPIGIIFNLYDRAVKKNDTRPSFGRITFDGSFSAQKVSTNQVVLPDGTRKGSLQVQQLNSLHSKLGVLSARLDLARQKAKQSIRNNGDYVIQGAVRVQSLDPINSKVFINKVNAKEVNELDMKEFISNAVLSTDDRIPSSIRLGHLEVSRHIETEILSGTKVDDYIHVDESFTTRHKFRVNGPVRINGDLMIVGLLNGLSVSPSDFLLRSGDQDLNWTLKAKNVVVKSLKADSLNGRDVEQLYTSALPRSVNFTLKQPTFMSWLNASTVQLSGLINGINLTELNTNSMKLNGDQTVSGQHFYPMVHLRNSTVKSGMLTPDRSLDDILTVRKGEQLSVGQLQLTQLAFIDHLRVTQSVAGLLVRPDGSLETEKLLNRTSIEDQIVTGFKTFETVKCLWNVTSGTINGQTLDNFTSDSSQYGHPENPLLFDGIQTNGTVRFELPITAAGVDGIDLNRLKEQAIPLDTENYPPWPHPFVMTNIKVDGDLKVHELDGMPTSGFVTKGLNEKGYFKFDRSKTFSNGLDMNTTFTMRYYLNGYNLTEHMSKALKLDADQTIPGSVVIENDVDIVSLDVDNNLPFIPLKYSGVISGRKVFQRLTLTGDWSAQHLSLTGLINDIDINNWPTDTVFKNRPYQKITALKGLGSLKVQNASVHSVDNLDIDRLVDLFSIEHPVPLYSDVVIRGAVSTKEITVIGTVDGVDSKAPDSWLRYGADQNISGSIHIINGSLNVDQYDQKGSWMVGDIDLDDLVNRTFHTDKPNSFESLHLDKIVVENLLLEGTIQGIRPDDLVLRSASERPRITGRKVFTSPLTSSSLQVRSHLNGMDPSVLCNVTVPPQSSIWHVMGNATFTQSSVLSVGLVNGINLTELLLNVWLNSSDADLRLPQSFQDVIVQGKLVEGLINNVNLTDLNRRSVKLSSEVPQKITAVHRFQSINIEGVVKVEQLNSTWINDVDTSQLGEELVLLRNGEQVINNQIIFKNISATNIVVDGLLNGFDLNETVVRSDMPDRLITGRKQLSSLVVKNAVDMCPTCLVNGVDLSSWAAKVVLSIGNITFPGPVHLENMVLQQPLELAGKLNNVTVDKNSLLTLSDPQTVDGPLTLSSLLPGSINIVKESDKASTFLVATEEFSLAARFVNLTVNGFYDGVNLTRFYNQSVRRNKDTVFEEQVVLFGLAAEEVTDSSNQSTVRDVIQTSPESQHIHVAQSLPVPSEATEKELSTIVGEIRRVVTNQALELKFFEEIPAPRVRSADAVDAVFAWQATDEGSMEMCYFVKDRGELFFIDNSSDRLLLGGVDVTAVAASSTDMAVASLNRSSSDQHSSFVFDQSGEMVQSIPTDHPLDCASFTLNGNLSCYVFAESRINSSVYCRPLRSRGNYTLFQHLATTNALYVVASSSNGSHPQIAIGNRAHRGHGRVTIWNYNESSGLFEARKTLLTLQFIAMDMICDGFGECLLAIVAPSKPAAIPGQVTIWNVSGSGPPMRIQRLPFIEPVDVKFASLPDGRLSLLVLQKSGVDNVLVHVWRNFLQFQLITTVRVPGAQGFQRLSNPSDVLLALSVASSQPDGSVDTFGPVRAFRAHFFGKLH